MIRIYNSTQRDIDKRLIKIVEKYKNDLDLIISYGGDGTLLGAERDFPQIEKLPIRSSSICRKCKQIESLEEIIKSILLKQIKPKKYLKLKTTVNEETILSLNEFCLKSATPNTALRFSFSIDDITNKDIIADGIIIATPFGSTGYFQSVTRTIFNQGIGVAVINPTILIPNTICNNNSQVTITIDRGEALLFSDNNPKFFKISQTETIFIKKSDQFAFIY